jgi:hypothetical protein
MVSIVDAATSETVTLDALIELADRAKVVPLLDEQACPITFASAAQ